MDSVIRGSGRVLWFDRDRAFGFIQPDDCEGPDLFVHADGCADAIDKGDKVSFDIVETGRGIKAVNVTKRI
jgi:CspA family cold shock protein